MHGTHRKRRATGCVEGVYTMRGIELPLSPVCPVLSGIETIETTLQVGSTLATDPLATCAKRQTCACHIFPFFSLFIYFFIHYARVHSASPWETGSRTDRRSRRFRRWLLFIDSALYNQRIRSHQSTPRTSQMSQSDNPSEISKQRDQQSRRNGISRCTQRFRNLPLTAKRFCKLPGTSSIARSYRGAPVIRSDHRRRKKKGDFKEKLHKFPYAPRVCTRLRGNICQVGQWFYK